MGSPCLFTRQQALKMGYFYWLHVKSLNHLHTELNLGYLKGSTFCLESKASYIDISSIASFKPFLIAWLRQYCTFQDSSVVNLNFFSFSICSSLDCSQQILRKIGGHRARLREKENSFRYRAQFEGNLLRFARARAHVRALMTRKSCAVEMRNAILRNYLKLFCFPFQMGVPEGLKLYSKGISQRNEIDLIGHQNTLYFSRDLDFKI